MIDINLLPSEYAPKKLVSISNLAMICLFSFIGISLILSSLRLFTTVEDYSEKVDFHSQQIRTYKVQAEEIRELGTKVKQLSARLALVKELLHQNATWSDKLFELCQCLPREGAWLEDLIIGTGKPGQRTRSTSPGVAEPITAQIVGAAVSVDKVRQFVASLEDSETFNNVVLDSVSSRSMRSDFDTSISFKITVNVLTLGS